MSAEFFNDIGAKRPFIHKTAGPIPPQMVFKQTIEEDTVSSTGVVKRGSAPLLWQIASNTKHSQYERLCSIRSHSRHSIAQRYDVAPTPD
jgi:hypothetical protein